MLAHLTKDILAAHEIDASRERVRAIQFDIFGRAQASKDLKQYATKIRNGGGRARPMPEIPDEVKVAALKFYQEHQDELKTRSSWKPRMTGSSQLFTGSSSAKIVCVFTTCCAVFKMRQKTVSANSLYQIVSHERIGETLNWFHVRGFGLLM